MNTSTSKTQAPDLSAVAALLDTVHRQPTLAHIASAARQFLPHARSHAALTLRMGCVSSYTLDPVRPSLELQALRAGMAMDTYLAPYGQFDRELIDPVSGLSSFNADVVLVAVRLADVCPAIYHAFNSLAAGEVTGKMPTPHPAQQLIDDWLARLQSALQTFRSRSDAYILLTNYDIPGSLALGLADSRAACSQEAIIRAANARLADIANALGKAYVMDYDALVARHGRAAWSDRRNALYARIPFSANHYWHFAGFVVRHLRPLYGLTKKVLVLDADNTLWGGVLGDAGLDGIALGPDYPGNAYVAFQQRVLDLYHRGVVLCIASKNEPGTVEEALEKHPNMVLRPRHFAAMRVNWDPKPQNVQAMAAELNLGIDSFVFVDDSDVECELMRQTLPQVQCVALPKEPADFAAIIESLDGFDQYTISAEDRRRGELYHAEAGRRQLQSAVVDMPTFYRQLQMKVTLTVNDPRQIARAAQMTNRTNQFNMNTIRCSEDDIRRFMTADDHEVITLALADRFGDSGVVGMAIIRKEPGRWVLHQLLMSCRILGRTVEQAFIAWIANRAREAEVQTLVGEFTPTKKNKPFAGFYGSCGFAKISSEEDVEQFVLVLTKVDTIIPDWVELHVQAQPESA